MRIAYLINVYPRPAQTFIWREIAALEERGVEVSRFALRRPDERVDGQAEGETARTRYVLDSGLMSMLGSTLVAMTLRPLRFLRALMLTIRIGRRSDRGLLLHLLYLIEACLLVRWLRQGECEHVHAHYGTNTATIAMLANALGGPRFSFTAHGPEEFDKPEFLAIPEKIERSAFAVAIAEFGRSQLCRWSQSRHWDKIHVVRCGIDDDYLAASTSPVPDRRRMVCIGRLSAQKGQMVLLQAAARLASEGVEFELVLIGDGELREEVEAFIERHGLQRAVRLAGWMNSRQVREELLASRALVMPSFAEGLPVAIMEALAVGRPVVSTFVAGIPELVEPGICGVLCPAGAVEPLVDAMRGVLNADAVTLERMGRAGAARVRERHDARKEAGRLLELFRRAVQEERRSDGTDAAPATVAMPVGVEDSLAR